MHNLGRSYLAAGRMREGISLLEEAASRKDTESFLTRLLQEALSRKDTESFLSLAAFLAWLGKDDGYATTRQRILAFAEGNNDAETVSRAAQVGALRPSTDEAVLAAVLALGRKAVELNMGERELLALGMAEFRNGHFNAADEPLLSALKGGQDVNAAGISAFYRAMSLFQLGRKDEARDVAARAVTRMKPLPEHERDIMAGTEAISDQLIQWLAYKEARAMMQFDASPPPKAGNEKK